MKITVFSYIQYKSLQKRKLLFTGLLKIVLDAKKAELY